MKPADGHTTPIWYAATQVPSYPEPPAGPLATDVLIVGAGIAGLTTAYLLAKAGRQVMVVDEGPVASGQTGRSSAHLNSEIDDGFVDIEKHHGVEGSKVAYQSHAAAIDFIERLSRDEQIDCGFGRQDALLLLADGDKPETLDKELAAALRAGFTDVAMVTREANKPWGGQPALRFGNQARFDPLKYTAGLAAACGKLGVRIQTGCRVTVAEAADPKAGKRPTATVDQGQETTIEADAIVVAANAPAPINWMEVYFKQASYRTYIVVFRVAPGSVDDVQYTDTDDPYHYCRLIAPDQLLVGGNDHKVGQYPKDDPLADLEAWGRSTFPTAGAVVSKWSGQVQETPDGLAYIGKSPTGDGLFLITGDSGMGLTHGTLGAMIVADLILGRQNIWAKVYDPGRKPMTAETIKEDANSSAQYLDLITGGDVKDIGQIPNGEGAVIRRGLHKVAVYKAPDGAVRELSAVCTHLKCVVHWNPTEKSWDCPCHGSRFSCDGKVLMGPAVDDLPPAAG